MSPAASSSILHSRQVSFASSPGNPSRLNSADSVLSGASSTVPLLGKDSLPWRAPVSSPHYESDEKHSGRPGRHRLILRRRLVLVGVCLTLLVVVISGLALRFKDHASLSWINATPPPPVDFVDNVEASHPARVNVSVEALDLDFDNANATWTHAIKHVVSDTSNVIQNIANHLFHHKSNVEHVYKYVQYEPRNITKFINFNTPRDTYREQLKPGLRYLTSMTYGGHSNQFIANYKLIYLAQLLKRVTILPALFPEHIKNGRPENMSLFYDLDRFYALTGYPVIEFSDVKWPSKNYQIQPNEDLTCWSTQEVALGSGNVFSLVLEAYRVRRHIWGMPKLAKAQPPGGVDLSYEGMRIFDHDVEAKRTWIDYSKKHLLPQRPLDGEEAKTANVSSPSFLHGNVKYGFEPEVAPEPSEQLMCLDNTLFFSPIRFQNPLGADPNRDGLGRLKVPSEEETWIAVGQYLHFSPLVQAIADHYVHILLGIPEFEPIPPYISLHLRRGDFKDFVGFTSLERYAEAVDELVDRLNERDVKERADKAALQRIPDDDTLHGLTGRKRAFFGQGPHRLTSFQKHGVENAKEYKVIVTTDEPFGSPFLDEIKDLGWYVLSHDDPRFNTMDKLGPQLENNHIIDEDGIVWWPTVIDAAVLSQGISFVGTDHSTFSYLAGLRVKYWKNGLVQIAKH